jgi:hypothetical protein
MLLARIFSYADAHRARVGMNYKQIPVNDWGQASALWRTDQSLIAVRPSRGSGACGCRALGHPEFGASS